jgi:sodium-dependent dicarboxylate transporter 2/3/5
MRMSWGALQHSLRRVHAWLSPATWNLIVALIILLFVSNLPLDPKNPLVARCAAITLVMSYLWMSAPIPIGCTALLPLPLFPILGISPARSVAVSYFNDTMWVFIGSFIVALAVEKSNLHRRIALRALTIVGTRPVMVLAAFMLVTASLSMVLSNTACAIMMVPIAGAMFEAIDNITGRSEPGLKKALSLGIAYASSTGGLTTLTGIAPPLIPLPLRHVAAPQAPAPTSSWRASCSPCTPRRRPYPTRSGSRAPLLIKLYIDL